MVCSQNSCKHFIFDPWLQPRACQAGQSQVHDITQECEPGQDASAPLCPEMRIHTHHEGSQCERQGLRSTRGTREMVRCVRVLAVKYGDAYKKLGVAICTCNSRAQRGQTGQSLGLANCQAGLTSSGETLSQGNKVKSGRGYRVFFIPLCP